MASRVTSIRVPSARPAGGPSLTQGQEGRFPRDTVDRMDSGSYERVHPHRPAEKRKAAPLQGTVAIVKDGCINAIGGEWVEGDVGENREGEESVLKWLKREGRDRSGAN